MENKKFILLFLLPFLSFCSPKGASLGSNANPNLSPSNNSATGTADQESELQMQALAILQSSCANCHGNTSGPRGIFGFNDVNHMLSTGLIAPGSPANSRIYQAVSSGAMPPEAPLTSEQISTIANWISGLSVAAAPTPSPAGSPTPNPVPGPGPAPISLQSQALSILQNNCTDCHTDTSGPAKVFGLTNLAHLESSGLIVPGSPSTSPIYNAISSKQMPPDGSLSPSDITTIANWITSL